MKIIIFEVIVVTFGVMGFSFYFLYRVFVKKGFVATEEKDRKNNVDPAITEWKHKHSKAFSIIVGVILFVFLLYGNIFVVFPFWADSKYIVTNSYPEFAGDIVSEVKTSKKLGYRQEVTIENTMNKEQMKVILNLGTAQKGDHIHVKYLPCLGRGAIE